MWTCPKCATRVDDAFEVCWQCGTTPEGVEDPEFLPADADGPIADPAIDADLSLKDDDLAGDFADADLPDVVPCYQARDTMEAKFVADRLMELGIPALADNRNMNMILGGWAPSMWGYGPCVRIRPEDLPKARAWLETYAEKLRARSQPDASGAEDDPDEEDD